MSIKRTQSNRNNGNGNTGQERLKFDIQCEEDRFVFTPSLSYQKLTVTQVASILCDALLGTTKKANQNGNINFTFTSAKSGMNIGFLNGVETSLTEDSTIKEIGIVIKDLREILCSIEPRDISKTRNAEERQADIVDEFGE